MSIPERLTTTVSTKGQVILPKAIRQALHWEAGMDFADALHLGAAAQCEAMLTFDRHFIEAARDTPVRVTLPQTSV